MKLTPLERTLHEFIEPVVADLGFALVCVKVIGTDGSQTVQVMAEDAATKRLGVDDAAKISRAVSATMDVEDPIKGAYRLEVSSPGIDRPLVRLQDFTDYEGFEAKIESDTPAENGQRKFRGRLQGLNGENILIQTDQGDAEVPFSSLVKAKLVMNDELIQKTANL
ncbi:MAG: ribosome maturation factor RimP [Pseudomonadota bacterium]